MEQSGLTEGSGVPIEDKEGYSSTTMTEDHLAAQSVSILVIREHIYRFPCYCGKRITDREHYRCTSIPIPRCKADFSAHLCVKTVEQRGHSSIEVNNIPSVRGEAGFCFKQLRFFHLREFSLIHSQFLSMDLTHCEAEFSMLML